MNRFILNSLLHWAQIFQTDVLVVIQLPSSVHKIATNSNVILIALITGFLINVTHLLKYILLSQYSVSDLILIKRVVYVLNLLSRTLFANSQYTIHSHIYLFSCFVLFDSLGFNLPISKKLALVVHVR